MSAAGVVADGLSVPADGASPAPKRCALDPRGRSATCRTGPHRTGSASFGAARTEPNDQTGDAAAQERPRDHIAGIVLAGADTTDQSDCRDDGQRQPRTPASV